MSHSFAIGWRQVAASFLLLACSGMIVSTYSLVAVPLGQEFKVDRMTLMMAIAVYTAANAVLLPTLGNVMDKVPIKRLLVIGGALMGAGYSALSFVTAFNQVLVIFALLISPGSVLVGPLAITVLLSRWFAEKRGRAVGIAIAGIAAGGFVTPMLMQALIQGFAWRTGFLLFGMIIAVVAVGAALLVIEHPAERGLHPDGAAEPPALAAAEQAKAPISVGAVLSDPAFWMIAVTVAIVTAGMAGMITNLAPLAIDVGVAAGATAPLVSIYAGCGFIAKLSFAALADKLGPRALMFTSLTGYALGMACMTQAPVLGYPAIVLGISLVGLFGGMMVPIESYIAPRVFGQRALGRAMGLLSGVILIGMLMTPPLFGRIYDVTGSHTAIFWVFCGLGAAALLWMPKLRLTPRAPTEPEALPAE